MVVRHNAALPDWVWEALLPEAETCAGTSSLTRDCVARADAFPSPHAAPGASRAPAATYHRPCTISTAIPGAVSIPSTATAPVPPPKATLPTETENH